MGFIAFQCRFPAHVSEAMWRTAMAAEIGAARVVSIEWSTSDGVPTKVGDFVFPKPPAGVTTLGTGDVITTEYALKVSLALGGERVERDGSPVAQPQPPAPWATTPWISKPWWQRLKVHTALARAAIREYRASRKSGEIPQARIRHER